MENLRQTAIPTMISDLTGGSFVKKEGMEPSYVLTKLGIKISRAKITGVIVDKFMSEDGNYSSITIDDDSDSIRAKAFKEDADFFEKFNIGENVMLIGKVREYNGEKYLIPEVIRKVSSDYETYHKLRFLKKIASKKKIYSVIKSQMGKFSDFQELKNFIVKRYGFEEKEVQDIIESLIEKEEKKEKDYKPVILEKLESLDKGSGVEIKKLLEETKIPEDVFQETIKELLSEGICYEPKPLIIKKV